MMSAVGPILGGLGVLLAALATWRSNHTAAHLDKVQEAAEKAKTEATERADGMRALMTSWGDLVAGWQRSAEAAAARELECERRYGELRLHLSAAQTELAAHRNLIEGRWPGALDALERRQTPPTPPPAAPQEVA